MMQFGVNTRGAKIKPVVKAKAKPKPPAPKGKTPTQTVTFDPNAPLTAATLNQNVQAATQQAYGGAEQSLQGQQAVSQQMMRNIPSWFADYQNALATATSTTRQAYADAGAAQQTAAASSSVLDASQRAALTGQAQQDAASRGATVDPALLAQMQQAASARRSTADAGTALTGQLGAAEVGFRANRETVGAGQELTALQQEAQRGRNLDVKAGELAKEKGAYAVTARQKLIDAEHTKLLENKAFGLNERKAVDDATAAAAEIDIKRGIDPVTGKPIVKPKSATALKTEADLAFFRKHGYYPPTGPPKAKAATPADRAAQKAAEKTRVAINTAAADARTLRGVVIQIEDANGKPTGKTRKPTESEIRAKLRSRYKDADVANAAMDMAVNGYVSPENARRLKARGITLPSSWTRPKGGRARMTATGGAKGVVGTGLSSKPPVPGLSP